MRRKHSHRFAANFCRPRGGPVRDIALLNICCRLYAAGRSSAFSEPRDVRGAPSGDPVRAAAAHCADARSHPECAPTPAGPPSFHRERCPAAREHWPGRGKQRRRDCKECQSQAARAEIYGLSASQTLPRFAPNIWVLKRHPAIEASSNRVAGPQELSGPASYWSCRRTQSRRLPFGPVSLRPSGATSR